MFVPETDLETTGLPGRSAPELSPPPAQSGFHGSCVDDRTDRTSRDPDPVHPRTPGDGKSDEAYTLRSQFATSILNRECALPGVDLVCRSR